MIDGEETRHLEGIVSLRQFAVADDEQLIGGLMITSMNTVDQRAPTRGSERAPEIEPASGAPRTQSLRRPETHAGRGLRHGCAGPPLR